MGKPRTGWDGRSPAYRRRLERNGISQAQWEAGISLSKARGHSKTPEHPKDIVRSSRPERFKEYVEQRHNISGGLLERQQWARAFVANFDRQMGSSLKYNRIRLRERTQITDPENSNYIRTDELIKGAKANKSEIEAMASQPHNGHRANPFYYH